MADNKRAFGQGFQDAVYGGIKSLYENPTVQQVGSSIKEGFFNLYDPAAAKVTEIGLPLLQTLTPEVTTTQAARDEILQGIEPYKPSPEGMSMMDRLGAQYDRMIADFGAVGQAMFGQARNAAEKLDQGIPFEDLTPEEQRGARMFLFEVGTLAVPGGIFTKPAVKGATALGTDILGSNRFRLSAGGEKAVTGKPSPTEIFFANPKNLESIKGDRQLAGLTPRLTETLKLADIIDQMSLEDIGTKNIRQIATENNLTTLINPTDEFGRLNIAVRRGINKFGLINTEKLNLLDYNAKPNVRNNEGYKKVFDFMNNLEEGTTFSTQKELAEAIGVTPSVLKHAINVDKNITGNIRNQVNSAVDRAPVGSGLPDPAKRFKSEVASLFKNRQGFKEYFDQIDKETLDAITKVRGEGGYTVSTRSAFRIFEDYMYDKYRSVKQTTGNSKLTAKQFVNNYINDSDLDNFSNYLKLERDRTILAVSGKDIIDDLATDPKYLPYLQNKNGDIDYTLLQADKAHDVPLFLSRIEGRNKKYKDVGRFKGAGVEPEIISPNFQAYNYLQANLDPFVNAAADVLTQKGLKEKYMKMPVKVIKTTAGKQNLSKDNIISTGLLNKLEEYGYKPDIKKFNNQFEFVNEISNVIDNIYKDRLIRTIVPVRGPAGKKDNVIFGIEDTQNVSINQKLMLGGERLKEILDYAIEKGISPQDLRDSKGYIKGFNEGGYVGDMIPVKASTGFFARLFGKTPAFRKEGMDVTDLTGPTKAQTQTLESLYPNTAFPEYVPGEVFFSNFDLALSKRDAPLVFNTNKEFRDYMNQSGVGLDELDDAKVLSFANSKFKEGQPVLAQDLLSIAAQSPVRNIFVDGYGFRSDKINAAPKNILDYTGNIITKQGEPVFKEASYRGTGLLPGAQEDTYRERVMRLSKEDLRGDPGSVPGGGAKHNFGDNRDNSGNYVMAWTRQTDRQGNIVPGQTVDRQTGEIVTPSQIADQSKLNQIEGKINKLFEDPITSLRIIDGSIDGRDMTKLVGIIDDLLAKGTIKSDPNKTAKQKAFDIVLNQALSKQKQLKKLQNEYNVEKARIQSFQPETTKEISTTVIDELQSDVFQNAKRKATELAVRLQVMAEDGIPLSQMRDEELLKYFQNPAELGLENIRPGSVFRPVGKTKEELMAQYNELMSMQQQLTALAQQPAYAITPANVNLYRDTIKGRQIEILDEMSENISNDLISSLYPDLPMKDRLQYADALSKQAIAEAAYRLFVEKDPNAPKYISFMSGEVVAGDAYTQTGRANTSIADRQKDKQDRIDAFKSEIRSGNPNAKIQQSGLPGVGTDEFYGGPLSKSVEGGHYTSTMESIFKKIAQQYGSKLEIINVAASKPTKIESYDIINQNTGQVVGSGDTYRQAENIANDLVDSEGGRYTIDRNPKIQYDTRPIFGMELTPQMLQLFKAYK